LTFLPEDILYGSFAFGSRLSIFSKIFIKIGSVLRGESTPLVIYQEAQEGQELLAGKVA